MAEYLLDMIDQGEGIGGSSRNTPYGGPSPMQTVYGSTTSTPLQASYMEDR